jgi:putative sigma-54 modulation protein
MRLSREFFSKTHDVAQISQTRIGGTMSTRKEKVAEFDQGYKVLVTARHMHISDGMKQHAIDRIAKLDHIGDRILDVNVTMDIQKLNHMCEILMKYGHTLIRSHASTTDMYASIDQAVSKLKLQLQRYKRKLRDHYKKGYPVKEIPIQVVAPSAGEETELEEVGGANEVALSHRIVAMEVGRLKILSDDEAVMKMELSGDPVMVFRAESDRQLKVIYRRQDGNYGIIAPEA